MVGWHRLVCVAAVVLGLPAAGLCFTTTVGGRRLDIDGALEVREVFETERDTPHERTQELLRLRAGVAATDWLRLEAAATGTNGGPTFHATKAGTFNLDDTFQDVDPSVELEEAFVDLDLSPLQIRLGKQKIYWGKLDRTQPNDLLNPYRYHDPLLQEQDERKIGVPAAHFTYAAPSAAWLPEETRLTLAWAPMYVPFRFPEAGERWFPPAAVSPSVFHIPGNLIPLGNGQFLPARDVPISFTTRNTDPPARRLENSNLGVRAAGLAAGVDFALYYYHGFDIQPAFQLLADAFATPNSADPIGFDISADTALEPVYRHVDAWGADAAYTAGAFTVRAEGAFIRGRPFARDLRLLVSDPAQLKDEIVRALEAFQNGASQVAIDVGSSFATRDAIEWGIGGDYAAGGWFALLQVNQTVVLHNDVDLLIEDVETRLFANLRKSVFHDRIQGQLFALYGMESDYTLLQPRLTWFLTDTIDARVGYLAVFGRSSSALGQFKHNDEGFVRLRVSF